MPNRMESYRHLQAGPTSGDIGKGTHALKFNIDDHAAWINGSALLGDFRDQTGKCALIRGHQTTSLGKMPEHDRIDAVFFSDIDIIFGTDIFTDMLAVIEHEARILQAGQDVHFAFPSDLTIIIE